MNEADLIAAQDDQRTKRNFISLLGGFLGVNDTSTAGQDGYAVNGVRNYQTIGLNGAVGVEGTAQSNLQGQGATSMPLLLLLAVGAFFLLEH